MFTVMYAKVRWLTQPQGRLKMTLKTANAAKMPD